MSRDVSTTDMSIPTWIVVIETRQDHAVGETHFMIVETQFMMKMLIVVEVCLFCKVIVVRSTCDRGFSM